MGTETRQKGIIYCTKEQFDTLMSTGSVVIGGQTFTYEDGWQYAVIDKDYVDLTSDQGVQGTKVFGRGNDDTAVVKIGPSGSSQTLISVEGQGPQAGNSVALNPDGIEFTQGGGTTQYLTMPTAGGTLARLEDISENSTKLYRHDITITSDGNGRYIITIYSTKVSAAITNLYGLRSLLGYNSADFHYYTSCYFYDRNDKRHIATLEFSNSNGEPEMYAGVGNNETGWLTYKQTISSISDIVKEI